MMVGDISVPERLSGRTVLKVMPLDYLQSDHAKRHHRLQVFSEKGVQCVVPGCQHHGAYVAVTQQGKDTKGLHYDVYTRDGVLMTVDHHIAKSNGGSEKLENKFPMCEKHNGAKGAKDPEVFYEKFGGFKK